MVLAREGRPGLRVEPLPMGAGASDVCDAGLIGDDCWMTVGVRSGIDVVAPALVLGCAVLIWAPACSESVIIAYFSEVRTGGVCPVTRASRRRNL